MLRCGGIPLDGFDRGSCLCEWQLAAADDIARALQQQVDTTRVTLPEMHPRMPEGAVTALRRPPDPSQSVALQ